MMERAMHIRAPGEQGFSLIEVLVSLLIFSAGVLGVVGMQAQSARLSVEATERNRASLMANELVALMWAERTTSPASASLQAWEARLTDEAALGLRSASYTIGAPDTDGAVLITITWTSVVRGQAGTAGRYTTSAVIP